MKTSKAGLDLIKRFEGFKGAPTYAQPRSRRLVTGLVSTLTARP